MNTGHTGGQYSLWRAATGIVVAALLARAALAGASGPVWFAVHATGALAALLFAIGLRDRAAAAVAALALLAPIPFDGGAVADATPFLPASLAIPLVAHLLLPPAPFGSFAARGRFDPAGGWRFPARMLGFLWGAQSALFALAGGSVLLGAAGPEAEAILPLAGTAWRVPAAIVAVLLPIGVPLRRVRPAAWLLGALLIAAGLPDATVLGAFALQLLLFDPAWIPSRRAAGPDRVFYDGACGFCQRAIRVILAEDSSGDRFRLAPRRSAAFVDAVLPEARAALPSSIVVVTAEGAVLVRSAATIRLLVRLGGVWRILGTFLAIIPPPLRDLGYRGIAAVRHRLLPAPERACPLLPPELRARFLPGAEEELPA